MPEHPVKKRLTEEERLTALKARRDALDARLKALAAKQTERSRKADTRRKILVGALLLDRMERQDNQGQRLREWLTRELPGFLQRDDDRTLFNDLLGIAIEAQPVQANQ